MKDLRPATKVVHAGRRPDPTGAVTPPIQLATTFERDEAGALRSEFLYGRYQNPNRQELEACMAALEGGGAAACFASGSAAAQVVLQALSPGARVVHSDDIYHGSRTLMEELAPGAGLACDAADLTRDGSVEAALEPETSLVWCESPTNPMLGIVDLRRLAEQVHARSALLLVDNTFATPLLQNPLALGADLVLHSTTKYLAGHGDVVGGVLVTRDPESPLWQRVLRLQRYGGAVPSPFDCWLALRGIATLAVRMRAHADNAAELAERLRAHPAVSHVLYPGFPDHPGYAIARRQMLRPGGMLSFRMRNGEDAVRAMLGRLRLCVRATSLGGVHTLIEHRAQVEPPGSRVPRDLVRLSAGIEDVEDLWADLDAALSAVVS